jgi:hypothetical protein
VAAHPPDVTTTNQEPHRMATHTDDLPDPALFWRWVGRATRPVVGWVLTGIGALALLIGYFGISREAIVAKQIPYLISGGIGGLALLIIGAVFLGTEDVRRDAARLDRLETMVEQLHAALLVADPSTPPLASDLTDFSSPSRPERPDAVESSVEGAVSTNGAGTGVVVLPQGRSFHRADCPMVEGKPKAQAVPADRATSRGLVPCRLCEPHVAGV